MRRNPSLLTRRILSLWHFEQTMFVYSARLQGMAELTILCPIVLKLYQGHNRRL